MRTAHRQILTELLALPTAPFAEHAVIEYIEQFCLRRPRNLSLSRDRAGNVLIHYRRGRARRRPVVCLTAHLDHPGFVADRMTGPDRLRAFWRGGVRRSYFVGTGVRFWVDAGWVRGVILSAKVGGRGAAARVRTVQVRIRTSVPRGAVGMWDLPEPKIKNGLIYARGCDDLTGAAAMLCTIDELTRTRTTGEAYFLFTRAEEVGFIGAIAACRYQTIPRRCLVIAVENSSQLPNARIGDGPILRVGDRASVFPPAATAYCGRVASALAKRDKSFVFQRKLMDGGTCESSAYAEFGYAATGLCVALGNYHNMDLKRRRIAPEYISIRDFENLVKWFVALVKFDESDRKSEPELRARLLSLEREYAGLLARTR